MEHAHPEYHSAAGDRRRRRSREPTSGTAGAFNEKWANRVKEHRNNMKKMFVVSLIVSLVLGLGLIELNSKDTDTVTAVSPGRSAYIDNQLSRFDWSKLKQDPRAWLDKQVQLEGWISLKIAADADIAEVWLHDSKEALEYGFERRSVEVGRAAFLKALEREGIKSNALATMIAGRCVRVRGVLHECSDPEELGSLVGEVSVSLIGLREQEMIKEINRNER